MACQWCSLTLRVNHQRFIVAALPLFPGPYSCITNFLATLIDCSNDAVGSPEIARSLSSADRMFIVDILPIPFKLEIVSQPVKVCAAGRTWHIGSDRGVSWGEALGAWAPRGHQRGAKKKEKKKRKEKKERGEKRKKRKKKGIRKKKREERGSKKEKRKKAQSI